MASKKIPSSKLIKRWINDKKKTAARLDKELKATKARIKKLEGELKKGNGPHKHKASKKIKGVAKK